MSLTDGSAEPQPSTTRRVPRRGVRRRVGAIEAFVAGWRRTAAGLVLVAGLWALAAGVERASLRPETIRPDAPIVAMAPPADLRGAAAWGLLQAVGTGMATSSAVANGSALAGFPFQAWTAAYAALWLFLTGGILTQLSTAGRTRSFWGASRTFALRFTRLSLLLAPAYGVLAVTTASLAADHLVIWWLTVGAASVLSVVGDFARTRMVVEDRYSAVAALIASTRFVSRRAGRIAALYVLHLLAAVAVLEVLQNLVAAVAVPESVPNAGLWPPLAAAVCVAARVALVASEMALAEGELGVGSTTPPEPVWPDAP